MRRNGFTLVELLVVAVLGTVTLAAVYKTLMVQEESYRAGTAMIHDQEALRTALGILESELREVTSVGSDIGGSDIAVATPDSVKFRAQRKVAFICDFSTSSLWADVAAVGDLIQPGDSLLVFIDGDESEWQDDRWETAGVVSTATTGTSCTTTFPGLPVRRIKLDGIDMAGVRQYSPIRSFDWTTYGLVEFAPPQRWSLARHAPGANPEYLVGGLAGPGEGLVFEYFDASGNPTTDEANIAHVRVTVEMADDPAVDVGTASLVTDLFLRNN